MINKDLQLRSGVFSLFALAFIAAPVSLFAGNNVSTQVIKSINYQKMIKIRNQEELSQAKQDKQYHKQINSLVKQYEDTAGIVARQGGDSSLLLEAANYYRKK